jgi:hydrogenase-4 component F
MSGIAASGLDGVTVLLALPAATAVLLALLPAYRVSALVNVISCGVTFLAALSLFVVTPATGGVKNRHD